MLTHTGLSQVLPAVMILSFQHLGHTIHQHCPGIIGWVLREDSKMEFRVFIMEALGINICGREGKKQERAERERR